MAMTKWQTFWRVVRVYTLEEKIISIIVLGAIIFSGAQLAVKALRGDFTFTTKIYTEAFVSNKLTLINPLLIELSELNPANRDLSALVFSGLTKYDPEKKAFVDDLATFNISEDKKVYTFTLKDHIKWHDGQPLTADDVYFTYHDLIQNPDFPNEVLKLNFAGVEVKKINEKSVQFTLQAPNSFFITNTNIGILPQHLLAGVPMAEFVSNAFNLKPIGSGPFKISRPVETFGDGKQRISLEMFNDYYGLKPKIEQIRYLVYPDNEFLMKELQASNVVSKVPAQLVGAFKTSDHFQLVNYELPQYTAVFFNMDKPVLKKEKVRLALSKSIDKNELLKMFDDKIAVDTPLLELNQSEWVYKSNFQEAQGALFDAGYKLNDAKKDGLRRDGNGEVLKLVLLAHLYDKDSPLFNETQKVTDFLKKNWEKLGISIEVQLVDSDQFIKRVEARDYDMVLAGQSLGYNLDTYTFWHSSQAGSTTPDFQNGYRYNLSNYRSYAASKLIEDIRDTFDAQAKQEYLKKLAEKLADDVPALFLYRPRYVLATDNKIQGISMNNLTYPSDRYSHIERWCLLPTCDEKSMNR